LLHLPLRVSATGHIRNSQSSVASDGLSLGENHFPSNSITWREMLTGLKTFLFYHGPDKPLLLRVSTQFLQGEDNNNNNFVNSWVTTATGIWVWTSKNDNNPHSAKELHGHNKQQL
jgi:hypothetical protein